MEITPEQDTRPEKPLTPLDLIYPIIGFGMLMGAVYWGYWLGQHVCK